MVNCQRLMVNGFPIGSGMTKKMISQAESLQHNSLGQRPKTR
jgi:hypothetical protein